MKKLALSLLAVCLLLSVAFVFSSCKKKSDLKDEVYTVSFSTAYLTSTAFAPESVRVKRGERVREPSETYEARAGYTVVWARNAFSPSAYDFSTIVTESFTLYAVEIPKKYKILYLLEMGSNSSSNPSVYDKTSEITFSPAYAPFGYKFIKWSEFDDPDSVVTRIVKGSEGDRVLRAVFSPVRYGILFEGLEDAENPNEESYLFGEEMILKSPLREGYRFLGFTINGIDGGDYVTALTPDFVRENQKALFRTNGSHIALCAHWEEIR